MSDNLPNLDSEYVVPKEKIDYFWENGFVVLKNVLSKEEIEIYRNEIKITANERNKNNDKKDHKHSINNYNTNNISTASSIPVAQLEGSLFAVQGQ